MCKPREYYGSRGEAIRARRALADKHNIHNAVDALHYTQSRKKTPVQEVLDLIMTAFGRLDFVSNAVIARQTPQQQVARR